MTAPTSITRRSICHRDRCFRLARPTAISLTLEGGRWVYDYPELGITGSASSFDDAIGALEAEFAFLWDQIASVDDDQLLADALELKHRMRDLVESVEASA